MINSLSISHSFHTVLFVLPPIELSGQLRLSPPRPPPPLKYRNISCTSINHVLPTRRSRISPLSIPFYLKGPSIYLLKTGKLDYLLSNNFSRKMDFIYYTYLFHLHFLQNYCAFDYFSSFICSQFHRHTSTNIISSI